ncbi:AMP-binding protein [bacterium]|nr:AMP-binding protein [bacterium]
MLKENLVGSFERTLKDNWEKPCFSDYGTSPVTFGCVAVKIKEFHGLFEMLGIGKGDRIAVAGKNSTNWAIIYLATVSYGAVIVPVLSDFAVDEIHHIVNHSGSKLFFSSESIYDRINDETMTGLKVIFSLENFAVLRDYSNKKEKIEEFIEEFRSKNELLPEKFSFDKISSEKLASIVYTSGTTGFSKGVMLSHNCLMANVQFFIDNLPVENDSRVVSFLPLAHCFGCAFDFLSPFVKGCHITFLGKIPSPKIILKAFEEIKPVIIFAVPLILEKIYRAKIMPVLESAKMKILMKIPGLKNLIIKKIGRSINEAFGGNHYEIIVGGAAFNPEIEEFFMKAGVRVTVGYGMTECGPLISYRDYYKGRPVGSCGKVINYLDIKIDSPDEHGVGEICVKGENIMDGYYKMDEQTAEAIDSEGWLHTGDLAYIDSEGFIFISGRSKNMILSSSGQNIYPEEIEAKINFMAYVAESLVLDSGNGKLVAYVYPDKEKMSANNITEEMVAEIMKENRVKLNEVLPLFAKVTDIRLYPEEFEKTSTKKIKRRLYTSLVK